MTTLWKTASLSALLAVGGAFAASAQGFGFGFDRGPGYRDRDVVIERRGPPRGIVEERIIRRGPPPRRTVCRREVRERVLPNGMVIRRPTEICREVGPRF